MSFPETPVNLLPSPPVVRALAVALLLGGCQLTPQDSAPDTTEDGLERIGVKGIDLAYMRPGASLAHYRRVLLDPVQVAFSKDWDPERTGSRMKLSADEREKKAAMRWSTRLRPTYCASRPSSPTSTSTTPT
jgi:hypothetical protein